VPLGPLKNIGLLGITPKGVMNYAFDSHNLLSLSLDVRLLLQLGLLHSTFTFSTYFLVHVIIYKIRNQVTN
jgi:hypothetical protein